MKCPHCNICKSQPDRRGGLCWRCSLTPAIRELYPCTSKYARRSEVGTGFRFNAPLPAVPTTAAPGTPEKLAVLVQRARERLRLHHPGDARYEGDPRPCLFLAIQSRSAA